MENMINFNTALCDIRNYFIVPENHSDGTTKFVSKTELIEGKGEISPEADKVIEAIIYNNNNYKLLSQIQGEYIKGTLNSSEVSLRDLYAICRGTGYKGEDISAEINSFNLATQKTLSAIDSATAKLEKIIDDIQELREYTNYQLTIRFDKNEEEPVGLLTSIISSLICPAPTITLSVSKKTYQEWKPGTLLPTEHALFTKPKYNISISSNQEYHFYSYLDKDNIEHPISKDLYICAQENLPKGNLDLFEITGNDFKRFLVINPKNLEKNYSHTNYYISIEQTFSSDEQKLLEYLSKDLHVLSIEIPENIYWERKQSEPGIPLKDINSLPKSLLMINGYIQRIWSKSN